MGSEMCIRDRLLVSEHFPECVPHPGPRVPHPEIPCSSEKATHVVPSVPSGFVPLLLVAVVECNIGATPPPFYHCGTSPGGPGTRFVRTKCIPMAAYIQRGTYEPSASSFCLLLCVLLNGITAMRCLSCAARRCPITNSSHADQARARSRGRCQENNVDKLLSRGHSVDQIGIVEGC